MSPSSRFFQHHRESHSIIPAPRPFVTQVKTTPSQGLTTPCGTLQYAAPEVLNQIPQSSSTQLKPLRLSGIPLHLAPHLGHSSTPNPLTNGGSNAPGTPSPLAAGVRNVVPNSPSPLILNNINGVMNGNALINAPVTPSPLAVPPAVPPANTHAINIPNNNSAVAVAPPSSLHGVTVPQTPSSMPLASPFTPSPSSHGSLVPATPTPATPSTKLTHLQSPFPYSPLPPVAAQGYASPRPHLMGEVMITSFTRLLSVGRGPNAKSLNLY